MIFLTENDQFPDVTQANEDGLLAIGGDLTVERLLTAYRQGIFPWYEEGDPVLWWSPDPRFVLFPEKLKISKSMKKVMRECDFKITVNMAFKQVIKACSEIKRFGQQGTWITDEMIRAYIELHDMGIAKSVEVWENDHLVGGLYGIDLNGKIFCGESMFSKKSNASKAAFITFIKNSNYQLIDCQVYTAHLESLGAEAIPRAAFLKYLS